MRQYWTESSKDDHGNRQLGENLVTVTIPWAMFQEMEAPLKGRSLNGIPMDTKKRPQFDVSFTVIL